MNNELLEHIRRLNQQERVIHEQRRIKAINRIKQLRKQIHEARSQTHTEPQNH